jgi:predicted Fe-S protein YdhL (DUF1289 family)
MITPCISICRLDPNGVCLGCGRSLQEIAEWSGMTDQERQLVMERLNEHTRYQRRLS